MSRIQRWFYTPKTELGWTVVMMEVLCLLYVLYALSYVAVVVFA